MCDHEQSDITCVCICITKAVILRGGGVKLWEWRDLNLSLGIHPPTLQPHNGSSLQCFS